MIVENPLIVIQPTSFCNIDCSYCYLPQRAERKRAPLSLIRRIADEVFAMDWWAGQYTFLWHLGEPLSIGPEYYEAAFEEIARAAARQGCDYVQSFQTNGTLIDPRWIAFFERHRVRLGVSIDGPRFIHDRCRRGRNGLGSHARTLRGVQLLQAARIPFGTITVLSDFSLDYPDEMVEFFRSHDIRELAFNIDELEGVHTASSFARPDAKARYRAFLERVLQLLEPYGDRIRLRELWRNTPFILGSIDAYNLSNQPLRIVSFDCNGNYSSFCPELMSARSERFQNFVMGNILQQGLASLPSARVFTTVRDEVLAGVSKCKAECAYWRYCGGGEPSSKFFEHGRFDVTETTTCKIHKQATIDAVLEHLEHRHLPPP